MNKPIFAKVSHDYASYHEESEQILHFKRLLVTLKQHYEKILQSCQEQLQKEQNQRFTLQKELDCEHAQHVESNKLHEEEIEALSKQQMHLMEFLTKTREEIRLLKTESSKINDIKLNLTYGDQNLSTFETRYIDLLNEKNELQKQLKIEEEKSLEIEEQIKKIEAALNSKRSECSEIHQQNQELQKNIYFLEECLGKKESVEQKYEMLKDDWEILNKRFEETTKYQKQSEPQQLFENTIKKQSDELQELSHQAQLLHQEKQMIQVERDHLKSILEESENRFKIAQQHLAKKVKETAVLNDKVEEQKNLLTELLQNIEHQKITMDQLHISVENHQKQERRLQDQLHDALKGTGSQLTKWEEKYFRLYEKWQECENKVRELKKFEEKHHQIQSLLVNLGHFIEEDTIDSPKQDSITNKEEEKYDLFGLKLSSDKFKSNRPL